MNGHGCRRSTYNKYRVVVISSAALLLTTTNHVGERFFFMNVVPWSESHPVTSKHVLLMDAHVAGPVAARSFDGCNTECIHVLSAGTCV